jgi:hypothetical protein
MAVKLKITEEFLWKFYEFFEALNDAHKTLAPRSWNDISHGEWREIRLAYEKKGRKKSFSQFISYLRQWGYVKISTGESVGVLQLTKKGKQKAFEGRNKTRALPPRKDGKMIMLMYDIPKNKQNVREAFRDALELLDYQMLQKSVWVSDKDVLEETERAAREYNLSPHIHLFIIEKIVVQN